MTRTAAGFGAGALALFMGAAPAALAQSTPPASAPVGPEVITVTATRVATNIQKTPVQVTAFSGAKLQDRVVNQMNDITYIAPSVRFSSDSGSSATSLTMRGIGNAPDVGSAANGSQVYFENAPQSGSINVPTYDLSNLQVLQGPQGTLFGRTAIGGAILIDPVLPSYQQDGYLKASYGNYNAWLLEGAANATIIPDVLALRAAGQIWRRDGYVRNLGTGFTTPQGNIDQDSLRLSLLFTPTPSIRNVTTFVYFNAPETGVPSIQQNPAATNAAFGGALYSPATLGALIACNHMCIDEGAAPQSDFFFNRTDYQVYNTTSWTINPIITLKNIFGYQENTDNVGQDTLAYPGSPFLSQVYGTATILTDDAQVIFNLPNDRAHGLLGFYYESDGNKGIDGNFIAGSATTNARWQTTTAVYGDLTVNLTDKLALNGGFRYQSDQSKTCTQFLPGQSLPQTGAQCLSNAAAGVGGAFATPFKASAPSWKVGLNYQATPDVFLYVTAAQATREPSINSLGVPTVCTSGDPAGPGHLPIVANAAATNQIAGGLVACQDLGAAIAGNAFGPSTNPADLSGTVINLQGIRINLPEIVTDIEVGIRSDWRLGGWRQRLNLTYFHYTHTNNLGLFGLGFPSAGNVLDTLLSSPPPFGSGRGDAGNPPGFNAFACNCSDITANGVQADLQLYPTKDLSFDFNVSYLGQVGKVIVPPPFTGLTASQLAKLESLPNFPSTISPTPEWAFSIAAKYVLPWHPLRGDLVLNYDYFWTGMWATQGVLEPGYDIHNMRLDWTNIANSNVSVGVWVRNMLDDRYFQGGVDARGPYYVGTYGEPRMFGVDVGYKFH